MGLIRILLVAFNAAIITYLVYRLVQIYRSASSYKAVILIAGIVLLLLPILVLIGIVKPTVIYVLIYPLAIASFIFLIKSEG